MRNRIATAFVLAILSSPLGANEMIDAARGRVWSLSHEGVVVVERSKKTVLALPEWVWVHAPYGCPPVLTIGPKGEAVVTSNVLPTLWRIDPQTLAVSVHRLRLDADEDKDVGFSKIHYSREHGAFLAASRSHGSLWRIDPGLVTARKVVQSTPAPHACGFL
jgi:hypothetical protein